MGSWCRGMPRHQLTDHDPIEFPDLALHNRSGTGKLVIVKAVVVNLEYLDVNPITRRQLDDLWEVKATQTPSEFTTAAVHVAGDTRYPIDVVYALLGGASPTAAWRLFRKMTRTELANAAGVSLTGLSSIERGLNSGNQVRDKLAIALAIPAGALIALF